jgi:hypothetical protein
LLFQTLAQAPDVATIGGESHNLIESVPGLHPRFRNWHSNRLVAADATEAIVSELSRRFRQSWHDRNGQAPGESTVMIEKTPKNSLRVPFFAAAFPEARFLFLYRDPRETIASMLEAWTSGRFQTYPRLPDWPGLPWSLLLVPGWRDLRGLALPEIVAHQWARTMEVLVSDLRRLESNRVYAVSHSEFINQPQSTVEAICAALNLNWDRTLPSALPLSPTVVSAPAPDKWRQHEESIQAIWPLLQTVDEDARHALAAFRVKS